MDAPELDCFDGRYASVMDYLAVIGLVIHPGDWSWIPFVRDQEFDLFKQFFDVAVGIHSTGGELNSDVRKAYCRYRSKVLSDIDGVAHRLTLRAMYDDGYRIAVDTAIGINTSDLRYITVVQFREVQL